jgi:large subunit ribosomal protein L10
MVNIKKKQIVQNIEDSIASYSNIALIGFGNTPHQTLETLRKELKKLSAKLKVVKNSLLIKALQKLVLKDKKYKKILKQIINVKEKTALLCLSDDYVSGLNAVQKLSTADESVLFKCGLLNNELCDVEKLKYVANLPSKNELYAKLINQIKSPAVKLIYIFNSQTSRLLTTFKIKSNSQSKQGGDQ